VYGIENFGQASATAPVDDDCPPCEPLSDADVKHILAALEFIDGEDYDVWLRVGMALKWTEDDRARGWWDDWSARSSSKFREWGQHKAWDSIRPSRSGRKTITLRTL